MPTLTRLILFVAVICACIYGVMLALVTWVHPVTTEIIVRIPASKILQQPAGNLPATPAPAASPYADTPDMGTPYTDGEPEAEDVE